MPDTVIGDHQRNKTRLELMKTADNLTIGDYFRRRLIDEVDELVRIRDAGRPTSNSAPSSPAVSSG